MQLVRIDPKYNDNKISDYIHMNDLGAVVAVPTPTVDGLCDDSIVREVLEELGDIPVLLQSTVLPDIVESYADSVSYNPTFLRAKTAEEDFDNQKHFIIGGTSDSTTMWKNIFSSTISLQSSKIYIPYYLPFFLNILSSITIIYIVKYLYYFLRISFLSNFATRE